MLRYLLFEEQAIWLDEDGAYLHSRPTEADLEPVRSLSEEQGASDIVVSLADDQTIQAYLDKTKAKGRWIAIRHLLKEAIAAEELAVILKAYQFRMQSSFRPFCPRCGSKLAVYDQEFAMRCENGHIEFPRISPCVMVLIENEQQMLLVRTHRSQSNVFSPVAGFVEIGESVEDAARREVEEETNVQIKDLRYVGSQSWPFPHSLMIGFVATYAGGEVKPDGEEVVEAKWFSVNELPTLPPSGSLSRQLIDGFLQSKVHLKN